jgi:hypothetical protein
MEAALAEAGVVLNASDAGPVIGTNGTDAYIADGAGSYTTAGFTVLLQHR